ncbi:MAG: RluA family pseudouridine synthase [Luminiphilus sp.]|nr:RluA family pseudouridine synthase [Luminiphilus sp.]
MPATYNTVTEPQNDPPPYLVPHSREAIRLLYRDSDVLIVDKPTLLLSVPGRHPLNRDCLLHRLAHRYAEVHAVHRLDLDTSGVMVIPRHRTALSGLARQFQERRIDKTYLARVAGSVEDDEGEVDLPLIPDWPNRPKQKVCRESGKPALTRWRVLERYNDSSLIELSPITGRSHQLRIHMNEIGHPILGCDFYAPDAALRAAPRLMLHATRLRFRHPLSGHLLTAQSPPPALFAAL